MSSRDEEKNLGTALLDRDSRSSWDGTDSEDPRLSNAQFLTKANAKRNVWLLNVFLFTTNIVVFLMNVYIYDQSKQTCGPRNGVDFVYCKLLSFIYNQSE